MNVHKIASSSQPLGTRSHTELHGNFQIWHNSSNSHMSQKLCGNSKDMSVLKFSFSYLGGRL